MNRGVTRARKDSPSLNTRAAANAFLFGLVFNQAQSATRAWQAPVALKDRLGTLEPSAIASRSVGEIAAAIAARPALHRFPKVMARYLRTSCDLLTREFGGDARKIWTPAIGLATLLKRLESFSGIGAHKALVGAFLLTNEYGVPVYDDGTQASIRDSCAGLYRLYAPLDAPRLTKRPGHR